MRTTSVAGIVFANSHDKLLKRLTSHRSMASVPFGARYRLIDFTLSNLVNAGVTNIGIVTKENYKSLMDHLGSGAHWDLDRRNGGLRFIPPYMSTHVKRYSGTIDALHGARDFIDRCKANYIVLCAGDILANIDISDVIKTHYEKGADITTVYHNGKIPYNRDDAMILSTDADGRVNSIKFDAEPETVQTYGVGVTVIGRELLAKLIDDAYESDLPSLNRNVLAPKVSSLKIYGYEHKGFASLMNGTDTYYDANMALLNADVRRDLFNKQRPIYTKTRDDMPTRYGTKAAVHNCFIADGCVINGTVKNSILFRGVTVEKGAVIENCILMQETSVGENASLSNVISDKNAVIGENMTLKGTCEKRLFVDKNEIV